MKPILSIIPIFGWVLLSSCAGGGKESASYEIDDAHDLEWMQKMSSYGYQVDSKGNYVPKTDKRSQYEGRGGSAYFNGDLAKKSFNTETMKKGSWMGGEQLNLAEHRLSGAENATGGASRFSDQQAALDRRLQTPARIDGNHLPTDAARESSSATIDRPSDAQTDFRRRVFKEPDIIDYKQQRELSIQQSRQLLGKD